MFFEREWEVQDSDEEKTMNCCSSIGAKVFHAENLGRGIQNIQQHRSTREHYTFKK